MMLASFDDLLQAARQQLQPQRLLFVFAGASLPADADAAQRERFSAGQGGELAPLMCVDKTLEELAVSPCWSRSRASLHRIGRSSLSPRRWDGRDGGRRSSSEEHRDPLQRMVEAIKGGLDCGFPAV